MIISLTSLQRSFSVSNDSSHFLALLVLGRFFFIFQRKGDFVSVPSTERVCEGKNGE